MVLHEKPESTRAGRRGSGAAASADGETCGSVGNQSSCSSGTGGEPTGDAHEMRRKSVRVAAKRVETPCVTHDSHPNPPNNSHALPGRRRRISCPRIHLDGRRREGRSFATH